MLLAGNRVKLKCLRDLLKEMGLAEVPHPETWENKISSLSDFKSQLFSILKHGVYAKQEKRDVGKRRTAVSTHKKKKNSDTYK